MDWIKNRIRTIVADSMIAYGTVMEYNTSGSIDKFKVDVDGRSYKITYISGLALEVKKVA
jgi:hypothetical protein